MVRVFNAAENQLEAIADELDAFHLEEEEVMQEMGEDACNLIISDEEWMELFQAAEEEQTLEAVGALIARAEVWSEQEERYRWMKGEHLDGGIGANTPRAQWIRGCREETRENTERDTQVEPLMELEDKWGLRILFGYLEPDDEPAPWEYDWEYELWAPLEPTVPWPFFLF